MISSILFLTLFVLLQKLIAYDHLEGDPGLEGGKNSSLFTDILNMVCGCVDNSSSDRFASFLSTASGYIFLVIGCNVCQSLTLQHYPPSLESAS